MSETQTSVPKTLEQLFENWIKENDSSWKGLARAVGCADGHLGRIARGEHFPGKALAGRIATTVGKPVGELPFSNSGERVHKSTPTEVITALLAKGEGGVYRTEDSLCDLMENNAISIIAAAGPQAPRQFMERLADRMKQQAQLGQFEVFKAYLIFNPERIDDLQKIKQRYEERQLVFEERGVTKYVEVLACEVKPPSNLDFFIVDKRHVAIAVKGLRSDGAPVVAVEFRDRPEIAGSILDWFLMGVGASAMPFHKWIASHESGPGLASIGAAVEVVEVTDPNNILFDQAMDLFAHRFPILDVLTPDQFAHLLKSSRNPQGPRRDAFLVARTQDGVSGALAFQYDRATRTGLLCYASAERGKPRGFVTSVTKILAAHLDGLLKRDGRYVDLDALFLESGDPRKYPKGEQEWSAAVGIIRMYAYIAGLTGWHLRCLDMKYLLPHFIYPSDGKPKNEQSCVLWMLSRDPIPATLSKKQVEDVLSRLWIDLYGSSVCTEDGATDECFIAYLKNLRAMLIKQIPQRIRLLTRAELEQTYS